MKTLSKIIWITIATILFAFENADSQEFKVNYLHGKNTVNSIEIINNNVFIGGYLGITRINRFNLADKELIVDPLIDVNTVGCFSTRLAKGTDNKLYIINGDDLLVSQNGSYSILQNDVYVIDAYVDENNVFWVLTSEGDLLKIENNNVVSYSHENSSLPDYYYTCLCARNNTVWLGTESNGLVEFKNGAVTEYNVDNSDLPYNKISSIDINSNGLWLSCYTEEAYPNYDNNVTLVYYSGIEWEIYNRSNSSLPRTWINNIVAYEDDTFVCTTDGLIRIDGTVWSFYTMLNNAILSDDINDVAFNQDELWIGTSEGLSLIKQDLTINIKIAVTPFSGEFHHIVTEDLEGNILVATGGLSGNLCKFDGQEWSVIIPEGGDNSFYDVTVDKNNVIWATIYNGQDGVYRIEGDSITKFDQYNSPVPSYPKDIIVDKNNNKWLISELQTLRYNDTIWTVYNHSDFPGYPFNGGARCIACDHSGNIWIGMGQRGMFRFDGTNWTHYGDSFFGNNYSTVDEIIVDSENNLWIDYSHMTIDPKLCKYDGSNLTWYGSNINLPAKSNGLMAVEDNGDIWYHGDGGLFKYNGTTWIDYSASNTRLLNGACWHFFIDSKKNKWISSDCYVAEFNEDILYGIEYKDAETRKFTIYPNPVTHTNLFVKTNGLITGDIEINIYSITGALLYRNSLSYTSGFDLDITNLKGNVFFIQLIQDGITETHKLIKY